MRLYIDPGTGSMLFTILVGVLGAGIYALRNLGMKLRFLASGGKAEKVSANTIPYAIFTDSKRYWNVFEPICDEFEKRKQTVVYMTASPDDPALKKDYQYVKCEFIGEGNRAFAKLNMLKADIVLSSTPGLDVYQWKRSKDVACYVHIPHAPSDITCYRMFGIDYFDAILLSGDYQCHQVRELERIRKLPAKELELVGVSYLDTMKQRLENAPALQAHPRTVLLAPSWGPSSILNRYGSSFIDELLKTGYQIIIRPHPQSKTSEKELLDRLQQAYPDSEQLQWNFDNDNFEVLRRSDILISDFSGVMFDFSLVFDKPIIYADTSFDKAPYDACWLEEELWTFRILPRLGTHLSRDNFHDIKSVIDNCLENPCFEEGREQAREETWVHVGQCAVRTVDYLMDKHARLLADRQDV